MNVETRNDFHTVINAMGYRTAVEVGVGEGFNAAYLLDCTGLDVLHGVENWGVRNTRAQEQATRERMAEFGDRFIWTELNSVDAAALFDVESIDYVYIDGCHRYREVKRDLAAWWPKVRKGGFFGGHDFVVTPRCGVVRAVNEFFESVEREFHVTNEPNDGIVNKSFWCIK